MTPLRLSVACGDYDINRALIDGEVRPGGMELTTITCPSPQRHWRMIRHREFDVCELSMASYLALNEREPGSLVAIPVFPHRRFRHGFIFVNGAAGVQEPSDLDGRRVGLRTWQTTAGLWARGLLQDEYGIDLRRIDWYAQDDEDIPIPLVPGLRLQTVPQGKTVTAM
ncbi:MAG: hypothetical protein ACRDQA_17100, partial [Nocardioidaceae bacterium]